MLNIDVLTETNILILVIIIVTMSRSLYSPTFFRYLSWSPFRSFELNLFYIP